MKLSSLDQIHRIREAIAFAGTVFFGFLFIGGLIALVAFFDSLLAPLK